MRRGAQTKWGRVALRKLDAECGLCGHPWGEHDTLREPHGCQTCGDCPGFVLAKKGR